MEFTKVKVLGIILLFLIWVATFGYLSFPANSELTLATTTSLENSGLLYLLVDEFEKNNQKTTIKILAMGSGAALKLARDGSVDAILVHAPKSELEFVNQGAGINRTTLWYNYFILVGPQDDPASVANSENINLAFNKIKQAGNMKLAKFFSRGDESGTHQRELAIWNERKGINLNGAWYYETGSGMSSTLIVASGQNGYTLSDLGTFHHLKSNTNLKLEELYNKKDSILYNPYSYIIVNPQNHEVNSELAHKFLEFLKAASHLVSNYKSGNQTLFFPVSNITA